MSVGPFLFSAGDEAGKKAPHGFYGIQGGDEYLGADQPREPLKYVVENICGGAQSEAEDKAFVEEIADDHDAFGGERGNEAGGQNRTFRF